jgi:K+/H+ antiporter YhaU regulatory subunit KhtT
MNPTLQSALGGLLVDVALGIVLVVLAGLMGVGVGLVHRWQVNDQVPEGLSVLVGLSAVALYLNTSGALGQVITGQRDLLAPETAVFNVITFFIAGLAAAAGGRLGDRTGIGLFAVSGRKSVEADLSRIVKTVGRVTTVEIPDEINDIDGYNPVDSETKEKLAGQTLLFPRRLTVEQLRERLIERLRTDYGVGHVDVDLTEAAEIEYLALGSREAGIGPTLPPGSAAVALKADPPNNASPGDVVQVWTTGDAESGTAPERITNAELRGTAEDVTTLAMDEEEARRIDTGARYRLVTLPVEARVDREFAAQLRSAAETMGVVTVRQGSTLAQSVVGAVDVSIVAVRTTDGDIEAIPRRTRTLQAGETVYAIGLPERLRKLEQAAAETATPHSESTTA